VKRIADWDADAVKILIYYSPFDEPRSTTSSMPSLSTLKRVQRQSVPFSEFVGYDLRVAMKRYRVHQAASGDRLHAGFSKPHYKVDVLVEVPINAVRRRQLGFIKIEGVLNGGGNGPFRKAAAVAANRLFI
jgi:tagatose 1,6-diphosphate aldolase